MTATENGTTEMTTAVALPSRDTIRYQLVRVREFQATVKELFVKDHDFGVIPGTQKPTMLKPGAEKLAKLLGLADTYDFLDRSEDWERGFFNYTVRCRLVSMESGTVVAEGLGNCNSWEAKYRWRWVWPRDLTEAEKVGLKTRTLRNGGTQYRIENDDIYSQVNTVIKMAKKRALVDAALSAGRLSDVFTQDMDDTLIEGESREVPTEPAPAPAGRTQRPAGPADDAEGGGSSTGPQGEERVTTGPSDPASEAQRTHIAHLLSDVGMEWADVQQEVEVLRTVTWAGLRVQDVAAAADWLNKRKRQARAPAEQPA